MIARNRLGVPAVMGAAGLVNCEIVRHQNHSCLTIASGDLAAECLRGQPGFEEKYNEKLVVVSGKITNVTPLPEGDLDPLVDALITHYQAEVLKTAH